jgi:hypothetical protein
MKMKISLISKILLAVALIVLIGTAYSMNRDYQDSWTLEGLEIPFASFVVLFAFAFYLEKSILGRLALAVVGRTIFVLIPAVKYAWFLGPYIDQNVQQSLANYVVTNGHIMTSPTVSQVYTDTPLMHLSFAMFSLILNIPVSSTMKYLPVFWSMLFPLLIYIIAKNMDFPKTTLLSCALFLSAIPMSTYQYYVGGSLFGMVLLQLILTTFVLIYVKTNRCFWPILLFSVIALTAAHTVTSMMFTVFLIILLFLKRFSPFGLSSFLSSTKVLVLIFIGFAWYSLRANDALQAIVHIFSVEIPTGTTAVSQHLGTGSFAVLRINPIAAIMSFIVVYGADVFFLLLSFVSLLLLIRIRRRLNTVSKFFAVLYSIVLVLIVVSIPLTIGTPRLFFVAELLYPIFSSIFIIGVLSKKKPAMKLVVGVIFLLIILLSAIEFYACQPLVPSANVLNRELPSSIKLNYPFSVNSVYQRQMIIFAGNYVSDGYVAAVFPITTQIIGLTDANFSLSVRDYDPLDSNFSKPYYNLLLINAPGPSGNYAGNPDPLLNDVGLMNNYISNNTIIYTNGESYILANSP